MEIVGRRALRKLELGSAPIFHENPKLGSGIWAGHGFCWWWGRGPGHISQQRVCKPFSGGLAGRQMENGNCRPHKGKSQKRQRQLHEPWLWLIWAVLSLLFLPPWPRQVLWTILSRKERTTKYGGDGLRRWLESAPRMPPGNRHEWLCKPSGGPPACSPTMRGYTVTISLVCAPSTRMGGRALVTSVVPSKRLCGCGLGTLR